MHLHTFLNTYVFPHACSGYLFPEGHKLAGEPSNRYHYHINLPYIADNNLKQHVTDATNMNGEILDLVITTREPIIVQNVIVKYPYIKSDHNAIHYDVIVTDW